MKKILLIGASGMAGHVIFTYLKEKGVYEIKCTRNTTKINGDCIALNVHDIDRLEDILTSFFPDIVINCTGILIKGTLNSSSEAIFVNGYFPHLLRDLCLKNKAKLIHISTDCVFSGKKGGYVESDSKDALDLYGQSKGIGEIIDNQNLTVRTSIIGPELKNDGEGLFDWMMGQKGLIKGYTKAFWSGVTTYELAKFIYYLIENNNITGLIHLTNNEKISKYDLLNNLKDIFDLKNNNLQIDPYDGYNVDKSFINTNDKIEYVVPTYQQMLQELRSFMISQKENYRNINKYSYIYKD